MISPTPSGKELEKIIASLSNLDMVLRFETKSSTCGFSSIWEISEAPGSPGIGKFQEIWSFDELIPRNPF